jgi:zinc protease
MKYLLLLITLYSSLSFGEDISNQVVKLDWNGLDVVWIKENRFPTYHLSFFFADGALSDQKQRSGETQMMFDFLDLGTTRYSQKQIADALDFYGVDYSARVTHEYSTFSVSGLVKDIVPTLKMVCHMFNSSTYPKRVLRREKHRKISAIKSMVNSRAALASRAERELSLQNTPYAFAADGKINSIKRITRKHLLAKRRYFMQEVKKTLYITGPKELLNIQEIINKECGLEKQTTLFTRKTDFIRKSTRGPKIYLVTVPKANQAQVRIGRFLDKREIGQDELMLLTSSFLGGGFTSLLMREVRVKRGLTYSIGAFAAAQAEYGRVGISTFTKSSTVGELLNVIKETLQRVAQGKFDQQDFLDAKGYLIGSYPFRFEKAEDFLFQLISLDHEGKSYERLYNFPYTVEKYSKQDVVKMSSKLFDWSKLTIVVLGEKKLLSQLKRFGKVKVYSYRKFL